MVDIHDYDIRLIEEEIMMKYGRPRLSEDLLCLSILHQIAQIHNTHRIGDVLHNRQVMGNEQVGQISLFLQYFQQINDLGQNGHVQGGHRLVTDDKFRI